jgi:WD40 repeat protein
MPAKVMSGNGTARRLPAAVIFLVLVLSLALSLAWPPLAQAAGWTNTPNLTTGRREHTATLLPNGKVLVVGGKTTGDVVIGSAELYDPATGQWTTAGGLSAPRCQHTATLLPNGMVLAAGGYNGSSYLNSAELYDPVSGQWSPAGAMNHHRGSHTATLLSNGQVLVTAGYSDVEFIMGSSELYNPASGVWTPVGDALEYPRYQHTATLLPDGNVLVAGGYIPGGYGSYAELYDPLNHTWTTVGAMHDPRAYHTATLLPISGDYPQGAVLVAGGETTGFAFLASAEVYNPATQLWTSTSAGLSEARSAATATLLPNGMVMVAGGFGAAAFSNTVDFFNSQSEGGGAWTTPGTINTARDFHTATLLASGQVLVVGGFNGNFLANAEFSNYAPGSWTNTGTMVTDRMYHTATLLPNGKVLAAGGDDHAGHASINSAELYNPATSLWAATGSLITGREYHTATLLPNGKVLVAGGQAYNFGSYITNSCELFDPAANGGVGAWATTGSMATARYLHTATLLANGQVAVIAGQTSGGGFLTSIEIYDPATESWTPGGNLNVARSIHTANLMPNGRVLVVSGNDGHGGTASTELYDPATKVSTATGNVIRARMYHTATLLPNGKVLAVGGAGSGVYPRVELYDPATGTWSGAADINPWRRRQAAALLPNGKVLIAGGEDYVLNPLATGQIYDPAPGTWSNAGSLNVAQRDPVFTCMPDGQILATGFPELYNPGLGFLAAWRPVINTVPPSLTSNQRLYLTGTGFRGVSGASGGAANDSPTDYPLVQLRRLDSGRLLWLTLYDDNPTAFSATAFESGQLQDFQTGHCLVTVFANGIPSVSKFTVFNNTGPPTAVTLKSFTAKGAATYVQLNWQTGSEVNTSAFRLWRRDGDQGDYAPNSSLIPAKGSSSRGAKYSYKDTQVVKGHTYYYQLEDIARTGADSFHGPVYATVGPLKKGHKLAGSEAATTQETVIAESPAPEPAPRLTLRSILK